MMSKSLHCTNCFKSLGVQSRMDIYRFIAKNKRSTVTEVVDHVGLKQPTVSYHLNEMKDNGILVSEKEGKEVHYSLSVVCPHFETNCVLYDVEFPSEAYEN